MKHRKRTKETALGMAIARRSEPSVRGCETKQIVKEVKENE